MFSYVDLVRVEIALEVGERFGVAIPDEETDGWRSLGDIARSAVARAGGAVTETEVFAWVRGLIADGYGVIAKLTPEEPVFADYNRMTEWFIAAPSPHHLGDRWFAQQQRASAVETHCCEDMRREVARMCDSHPDRHNCPDCVVGYSPRFREYGLLVHDGGSSSIRIQFCPWCGAQLPASLRAEWFAEMERRGIDPCAGEVPAEFQSSVWWATSDENRAAAPDGGE